MPIENEEKQEDKQEAIPSAKLKEEQSEQTAQELFIDKYEELFTDDKKEDKASSEAKQQEEEDEKKEEKQTNADRDSEQPDKEEDKPEEGASSEEKSEDKESHEDKDEEDETEPIPQDQVDIARHLGFSDEEIVKMAESSPGRLERMVGLYSKPEPRQEAEQKVSVKPEIKETPKLDHLKLEDLGDLDPETAKALSEVLKSHNSLVDDRNKQSEELDTIRQEREQFSKQSTTNETSRVDNYFDSVVEDVPELGESTSLTGEQINSRKEIYGMSVVLQQSRGLSPEHALEEATYWFSMSKVNLDDLKNSAEERVKEKINKNKKRMSPRPSNKISKKKEERGPKAALDVLEEGMKELFV